MFSEGEEEISISFRERARDNFSCISSVRRLSWELPFAPDLLITLQQEFVCLEITSSDVAGNLQNFLLGSHPSFFLVNWYFQNHFSDSLETVNMQLIDGLLLALFFSHSESM